MNNFTAPGPPSPPPPPPRLVVVNLPPAPLRRSTRARAPPPTPAAPPPPPVSTTAASKRSRRPAQTASSSSPASKRARTSNHSRPPRQPTAASASNDDNDWMQYHDLDHGDMSSGGSCPVCAAWVLGTSAHMNVHLDACLERAANGHSGRASTTEPSSGPSDNDDDDHHVRSSLSPPLPPPPSLHPASQAVIEDADLDLDIAAGPTTTAQYGATQFTEMSVMPYAVALHGADDYALRAMVATASAAAAGATADTADQLLAQVALAHAPVVASDDEVAAATAAAVTATKRPPPSSSSRRRSPVQQAQQQQDLTITALKERIRELEHASAEAPRCRICLELLGVLAAEPRAPQDVPAVPSVDAA
ncbi:hypothetical protein BC828DRAFT_401907 [Blastocladiella britannica]|nr:hypothetical protein BC828DRAFT_401907 [Blastocladiella britannica]